jgi:hypothetical protein
MQIQERNYVLKYSLKLAQLKFNSLQLHMKRTNNSHKSHVVILI